MSLSRVRVSSVDGRTYTFDDVDLSRETLGHFLHEVGDRLGVPRKHVGELWLQAVSSVPGQLTGRVVDVDKSDLSATLASLGVDGQSSLVVRNAAQVYSRRVYDALQEIRALLSQVVQEKRAAGERKKTRAVVRGADLLFRLLINLVEHPLSRRYRRVKAEAVATRLVSLHAYGLKIANALPALGFRRQGAHFVLDERKNNFWPARVALRCFPAFHQETTKTRERIDKALAAFDGDGNILPAALAAFQLEAAREMEKEEEQQQETPADKRSSGGGVDLTTPSATGGESKNDGTVEEEEEDNKAASSDVLDEKQPLGSVGDDSVDTSKDELSENKKRERARSPPPAQERFRRGKNPSLLQSLTGYQPGSQDWSPLIGSLIILGFFLFFMHFVLKGRFGPAYLRRLWAALAESTPFTASHASSGSSSSNLHTVQPQVEHQEL